MTTFMKLFAKTRVENWNGLNLVDSNGNLVAEKVEPEHAHEITRAVNAYPDMLAALREARQHLNSCTMGDSSDVYNIIDAAIQNATKEG